MQSMDWQTLVARRAKKDPIDKGGWNIAMTAAAAVLLLDPVNNHYAEASGDRAQFGWPLDEEIEKLRAAFVREGDPKKQLEIAEKVQTRIISEGVTIPARPVPAADGAAQDRERQRPLAGHGVLERREKVAAFDWELSSRCPNATLPVETERSCRRPAPRSSQGRANRREKTMSKALLRRTALSVAAVSRRRRRCGHSLGAKPPVQLRLRPAEHHGLRHRRRTSSTPSSRS